MGLFDEILGSVLGSQGDERTKQSSSLVAGLLDLLDEPETGGIAGLARRSQEQGLGERRIFEANRDQIKNPDLIHPGQKLRIPRA